MKSNFLNFFICLAVLTGCQSGPSPSVKGSASAPARPSATAQNAAAPPRIEAGASGFRPSRVALGPDHRLVFRRTTDDTCATAVAFPSLGLQKPLPLNKDVAIDLPPSATGEITFQCGMGMYRGAAVAVARAQ